MIDLPLRPETGAPPKCNSKKGLRVKHPLLPDWGVGEVLEDSAGDTVKVFFVGAGEKMLSLRDLGLIVVEGNEANHPILNNLKITAKSGLTYRTLPESTQRFLKDYPGGFMGKKQYLTIVAARAVFTCGSE